MTALRKLLSFGTLAGSVALAAACGGGDSNPAGPGGGPAPDPHLTAPAPESPKDDVQLATLKPTLTVRNGTSDQAGTRTYEFQISDRTDFTITLTASTRWFPVTVSATSIAEGVSGTTSFTPDQDLQPTTRMYWRARIRQGTTVSSWSPVAIFRTKLVGYNRAGELYDPLVHGETVGARVGSTTFIPDRGLRIDNTNSWVRYRLVQTISNGEFSVEVEGLAPNSSQGKGKIFSMMDGGNNLLASKFLANVQYRGVDGNPPNCISFKALFGDSDYKVEPDKARRTASVKSLNPARTYLWKATWNTEFRLVILDGGLTGTEIYDYGIENQGTYNPSPHVAYLGANNGPFGEEGGSFPGAVYRNVWIGNHPRPESLGSALRPR
jgi:hypothetical protein